MAHVVLCRIDRFWRDICFAGGGFVKKKKREKRKLVTLKQTIEQAHCVCLIIDRSLEAVVNALAVLLKGHSNSYVNQRFFPPSLVIQK